MYRRTIETRPLSIDFVCEWGQLFKPKRYNWIEFHYLMLRAEEDIMHGQSEIEVYLLGFGIRIYWISDKEQSKKKFAEYDEMIKGAQNDARRSDD